MPPTVPELDLLPTGMHVDQLGKGEFIQNMLRFGSIETVRAGFGQVAQFDTTFAFNNVTYEAHLGSHYMRTNFDHEQIVSVFRVATFTGSLSSGVKNREIGQQGSFYLVTIYDITTDNLWEELIYPKTAGSSQPTDEQHGLYETNLDINFEDYTLASSSVVGESEACSFAELNDTLFFCNRRMGLQAYFPATFKGVRCQQVNGHDRRDWQFRGPSEGSLIVAAVPANGVFRDNYSYLDSASFPKPDVITTLLGRLVLVAGTNVYFSDVGQPMSIAFPNAFPLPSDSGVTAVHGFRDNLLLWTHTESYFYQPNSGDVVISKGRLTRTSDTVGCAASTAVGETDDMVVWVDRVGVFSTSNGLDVNDISTAKVDERNRIVSGGIRSFWQEGVSNPLTAYYQQSGFTSLANDQPRTFVRFEPEGCHVVYDSAREALFVVVPDQAVAWVLHAGRWRLWNFESVAAAANTVKATRNIRLPWLIVGEDRLFCVGSTEDKTLTDSTLKGGTPGGSAGGEAYTIGSHYLLEYGRGGGLDRSVGYAAEDQRRFSAKMYSEGAIAIGSAGDAYYIGEWIPVPVGYTFPGGTQVAETNPTYLVPIEISTHQVAPATAPNRVRLKFRFDNTHWNPVRRMAASAELDILAPSERLATFGGWSQGAPAALNEAQVYDSTTGLPTTSGNEIRLAWNSLLTLGTIYAGLMNVNCRQRSPFVYVPMQWIGGASVDATSMGLLGILAEIDIPTPLTTSADLFMWQQAQYQHRHAADDVAQPVDWILRTDEVGFRGPSQISLRTLYAKIRSHGAGTNPILSTSVFGLFNVLIGSDWKGWSAQIVDFAGNLASVVSAETLRARVRNASLVMKKRIFNDTATWGNSSNSAHGNFLIDDEQVDTIAVSSSVKGEHVFALLWGHVRDKAEALSFDAIKGAVMWAGGRRRTGR